jgi:alpha-1,6-mannosyltransferase
MIDSYFWGQWPLWPELHGIWFNVLQGNRLTRCKLTLRQVSPFHSYFLVHLPKLLLTALPLAVLGVLVDHRQRAILLSAIVFVSMMSVLAHKEWRFVIYVVPFFNLSASIGATQMYVRPPSISYI